MNLSDFIKIDDNSRIPKYRQIVDSIIKNISEGHINADQKMPSINVLSEAFYLSRDTVHKAYNILKERNIIVSVKRKGYYISQNKLNSKVNILFMINKLSSYKMRTFNHFVDVIGANSHTDLNIYHCDEDVFLNLLENTTTTYDFFIIMPHFKTDDLKYVRATDNVVNAIKKIPKEKLVILDNINLDIEGSFIEVYQDFENDIYSALQEGLLRVKKYQKIILIYPDEALYPYPTGILDGFCEFCLEHKLDFEILGKIYDDMVLKQGDLFITIEEPDLVNLVKRVRDDEYRLGTDIGVISYNDTPLKELLDITVISTDFKVMGETAASMILNNKKGKKKVPFNFIDRGSA